MARELTIQVTADTRQAERSFASLDKGIAQVEKDLTAFEQQIQRTEQAKLKATKATDSLTNAIKGYLTAGAVIGAVKATTDWASALTDLSAKTGISTTMLQKLQIAAGDSGITVERMAQAIQMMSDRLASGDKSAVKSLGALGLSFEAIRKQSPDQAFLTIAGAVGKIEDPMKRAQIAADLFGRSGLDLTRLLNGQFVQAVESATTASEESVAALDDMGDSFTRLWTSGKQLLAVVLQPMAPVLQGIASAAGYAAQGLGSLFNKIPSGFGVLGGFSGVRKSYDALFGGTGPLPTAPGSPGLAVGTGYAAPGMSETDVSLAIKDLTAQAKDTTAKQKKLGDASEAAADALAAQAVIALRWNNIVGTSDWLMARAGQAAMGLKMPPLELAAGTLTNPWGGVANTSLLGWGGSTSTTPRAGVNWGALGMGGLTAAMPWLSQLVAGGSSQAQLGGSIGGSLGGVLGSKALFGGLSGLGGFAGLLGAAAPFLGPVLGIVGSLVGKLFGPSEGKLASNMRGDWITSLGGNEAFNDLFRNAQIAPDQAAALTNQLMSATSREQVKAAQDAINAALAKNNALLAEQATIEEQITGIEEQRKALAESLIPTYEQVASITSQYGINLDAAGEKVSQLGTTDAFMKILNDIETLNRAGFDTGTMLDGMADEISTVVQRSVKLGTEIPANMRPYIQSLIDAGKLLDEQGQAITDITQLKFGPAVKTQADIVQQAMADLDKTMATLVDRLEDIVDLLANKIPGAAAAPMPTVTIPYQYEQVGPEPEPWMPEPQPMARGGIVTRPTVALLGEAGPEAVVPLSRARDVAPRPPTVIQVVLEGRVLAETVMRELPGLAPAYGV